MEGEHCLEFDDMKICYRIHGGGPLALLLLHGAVGSYQDFYLQMTEDSPAFGHQGKSPGDSKDGVNCTSTGLQADQFTVIAPDLPGYGKSEVFDEERRANCMPTLEYFELCANVCAKLMEKLNFKTYSLGGWNDGARVAALMAINYQSRIDSLILWGFSPVMDKASCLATARARDTSIWEPEILKKYCDVYGEQNFADLWRRYVDFVVLTLELPDQFDIRERLNKIKCPTLVLHGSNDPIINFTAHVKPIEMQIYDSEIVQFQGLAHNIHQADPIGFNKVLTKFVSGVVVSC